MPDFDHVAILVRDLDAARAYWTGVLGFPVAREPDLSALGLAAVYVGTGRGQVELYTILDPVRLDAELGDQDVRLDHIAMISEDLDGLRAALGDTDAAFRHPGTFEPTTDTIQTGGMRHAWTDGTGAAGVRLQVSG